MRFFILRGWRLLIVCAVAAYGTAVNVTLDAYPEAFAGPLEEHEAAMLLGLLLGSFVGVVLVVWVAVDTLYGLFRNWDRWRGEIGAGRGGHGDEGGGQRPPEEAYGR